MRTQLPFALLATALACTYFAAPAQAQSPRTFVSAAGNDSNPCTFAAPCRHFQAAVTATSPGGEVDALDPAGYGPITITQAVTIEGQGWSYIAPPSGGAAITINATGATDKISIRGVSLNGVGISNTQGILFNSGGSLNVRDCVIQNFSNNGIFFGPSSSTATQIFVSNTLVSNNGINGIGITPSGSAPTNGVLNHVEMDNNGTAGLFVSSASQTINITVSDSVSANNADGIFASSGGTTVDIMVRNSTITDNTADGLLASGGPAQIWVTRSSITGNGTGSATTGGNVTTFSDNTVVGNTLGNGFLSSLTYH